MSFDWKKCFTLVLLPFLLVTTLGWCGPTSESTVSWSKSSESGSDEDAGLYLPANSAQLQSVSTSAKSYASTTEQALVGNHESTASEGTGATGSYVGQHIQAIRNAIDNPFSFVSHKANYLLPAAYRQQPAENGSAVEDRYGVPALDPLEVQFQLSLQLPVWSGFLGEDSFLSVAYTNRSFWQAYTGSGIFREIDHEAELLATWASNRWLFGFHNVVTQVGVSHQSNGRGGNYSRGWNRVYTNFIFERGNYFLAFKPWYRLSKDYDEGRGPDFDFYLGNFELTGGYRVNRYSLSIMLRNNLRSKNRGALELRWGFPITNRLRGFVKYFDGYGESLIDYSTRVRTLGIGLEVAPSL